MKQFIFSNQEGQFIGPISEKDLEEGLKSNKLKAGMIIYCIDRVFAIEEIHESKLIPYTEPRKLSEQEMIEIEKQKAEEYRRKF